MHTYCLAGALCIQCAPAKLTHPSSHAKKLPRSCAYHKITYACNTWHYSIHTIIHVFLSLSYANMITHACNQIKTTPHLHWLPKESCTYQSFILTDCQVYINWLPQGGPQQMWSTMHELNCTACRAELQPSSILQPCNNMYLLVSMIKKVHVYTVYTYH